MTHQYSKRSYFFGESMNNLPRLATPRLSLIAFSLAAALCSLPAHGQTHVATPQTNSGQLLQQMQQPQPQPPSSNLDLHVQPQKQARSTDATRFYVRTIELTGNRLIMTSTLHALVAPGEGHELSLDDLDQLAGKLSDYYHDHGYPLAVAYVPAQTLRGGVVRIAIVEARYGKVELDNQSKVGHYPLSATLAPLESGQPVREYGLERSLLLLSDVPGAIVSSMIRPGEADGTSDLVVSVTDAPRYTGTLGMDDYGNAYTDRVRFSGTFDVNGLFHQGDLLDVSGVSSGAGMSYGHVGYRYLLTGQGTTLGMAVSGLAYKLGNGLTDLHAHGTATTQSVNLSQPIIRHTAGNLYSQLEFDHKRLYDDIDVAGLQTHRHSNSWVLTVAGDQRDRTGITNFNLSGTRGRLYLDNFQTLFADYFGARTAGSYLKWDYSISRLQQLNAANALYFGFSGQHANKNLDTSEQFYLGGPSTVRGYDVGVLSGAQGTLATVEYRHDFSFAALPGPWQASAFVDSGRVQAYKQPFMPGQNSGRLNSAGVGLHWTAPHDWVIGTSVAKPIGNKPVLAGTHAGQAARFWLQVQKGFY
jgi:hemolysin activation/secretion protein